MNNLNLEKGQIIKLQVVSNSKKELLEKIDNNSYKIKITALAIKGKANKEILKFFKKQGYNVDIIKGKLSSNKILKIHGY
jgi:uncharacterized protein (TIGR00251 family)